MTTQLTHTDSTTRAATGTFLLPGLLAIAIAIYTVGWGPGPDDLESLASRLSYGLFGAYLAASVAGAVVAVRAGLAPRVVAPLIGVGYGLVLAAVVAQTVMASEPTWFMFVAGPGQLLAIVGFVTWAVWGSRSQLFNLGVALLCGVGGVTAIIGSEAGLSVLIAGFWFTLFALRGRVSAR